MILQSEMDRLILSLNVKLHIKSRGLSNTPFKRLRLLHKKNIKSTNLLKFRYNWYWIKLIYWYTISNNKSGTIDTRFGTLLARLKKGISRFK